MPGGQAHCQADDATLSPRGSRVVMICRCYQRLRIDSVLNGMIDSIRSG
jgi:hypothetical protein